LKLQERIKLLIVIWSAGLLGGLLLWLLRLTKRLKIQGYHQGKFKPNNKGLIVIYNHPSLWEPSFLPFLLFPSYLFSPRFAPFSTPDKINYYDKWWFFLFRAVCIPIERGNLKGEVRALNEMKKKLAAGRILILAPEGGRTFKGDEFKVARSKEIELVKDISGTDLSYYQTLRRFKSGIGWLVYNTQANVLPVWAEGGESVIPNRYSFKLPFPRVWRQTKIKIGEPLDLGELSKKEIVEFLEDSMLMLGSDR